MARALVNTIGKPVSNYVINGNFYYWQRRTSYTGTPANGAYLGPDRWRFSGTGSGTATISRQAFTVGQTDVPGNPIYYMKWNQTVAASNAMSFDQRIENVALLSGKTINISFYARSNSGAATVSLQCVQSFGTGGSPSGAVTFASSSFNLTSVWQKCQFTVTVPSIVGKTLGNDGNGNDFTAIGVVMPATGTYNIDCTQFMVSESSNEFVLHGNSQYEELRHCQRYFEKTYLLDLPIGSTGTEGAWQSPRAQGNLTDTLPARYMVVKRITPATTVYSTGTGASGFVRDQSALADKAASVIQNGTTGFAVSVATATASPHAWHFTAEAEL